MDREELKQRIVDRYGGSIEELLEILEIGIEDVSEFLLDDYYDVIINRLEELDLQ